MILSPASTIERNYASGVWGRVALDALFRKTAKKHPERLALVDEPNRASWTSGDARSLTYEEADREISRLAGLFKALGLTPDSVIGLQLPNTTDAAVIILAALRAGLIVTPIPLVWRGREIADALSMASAKAVITTDRLEGAAAADWMRDAAVEVFGLRYVLGLGDNLPDGLISLSTVLAEVGDEIPPADIIRGDRAADHLATLTWTVGASGRPLPVPRTHNHWVAAGLATILESRIADGAKIVLPYSMTGLAGLGCGIVPWLLSGGTLHLHHPEDLSGIARHAKAVEADLVVVPGQLASRTARHLKEATTLAAIWQSGTEREGDPISGHTVVDVTLIQEFAAITQRREDGTYSQALPLRVREGSNGISVVELKLDTADGGATRGGGAASLLVRGAMVPECAWPGAPSVDWPDAADGYLRTRLMGLGDSDHVTHLDVNPFLGNSGLIGGISLDLVSLDTLYKEFDGVLDAAAFLGRDPILGTRLYAALVRGSGKPFDRVAFDAFLDGRKIGLQGRPADFVMVDAIPRSESGFVNRKALEALLQDVRKAV
ncbi:acyl-CoA synthetase (AMP-forming)/AMP-acid ligase II [Breoghania corrubedonensis]|uniref:Acyl-CoA synthetase (AMP-forming)/AMP-acid ligase II n=1 Tax=Breoghania corrubedonensis TaxID=665038 RepID=A0A2T5VBA2_9HYPH|nr:class I adenylate-forming enzyme family protein [Breoghania corrubedonensis]PTW61024.1 acyl-CoA synthetase (AMP-forming)/AMP-acid ligase II [Breoghania corrubedonensis]